MLNIDKKKVFTLLAITLLMVSLLLVNVYKPTIAQQEENVTYLHGQPLTTTHMHSQDPLVPIHLNSNMTLTPIHMHYVGPEFIDPIYEPLGTSWHELYPEFCPIWDLTSWEDNNADGLLSPNDQIDMTDELGNVTWYHVDRITWTLLLSNESDPSDIMYVEFKGPPEVQDPIPSPICTYWHEVYPSYSNVYHIIDSNGRLEFCTYVWVEEIVNGMPTGNLSVWHVEEVVADLILREKIMDPINTWWHEVYPDYCQMYNISGWEDNGDGKLSPGDQIETTNASDSWKWEVFWSMGDVNEDGIIDLRDFKLIVDHFGTGDTQYDIDEDSDVDTHDLAICAINMFLDIWTYYSPWTGSAWSGKKEMYFVDRVTIALNVTSETDPNRWMKIEMKTFYLEEMYNALKHPVDTLWHEVYPDYSNVYILSWWDWLIDDNCNGVLDYCDYIWLINNDTEIEERYHVENVCYDIILNKKIIDPRCTSWDEIYPDYFQEYHLTSWEDNGDDRLSPCDQIDMLNASDFSKLETFWSMGDINRDGYIDDLDVDLLENVYYGWQGPPGVHPADLNKDGRVDMVDAAILVLNYGLDIWTYYPDFDGTKKWYHVDRVTLTMYITINSTGEPYYFEFKGPFESLYQAKINPIGTMWSMVWPEYLGEGALVIEDWIDNCNGVLDYCDYILLGEVWCHIEELAIDIILNEKIADPIDTWWHELYPTYCNDYQIAEWTDNGDGLLSPCDWIVLAPTGMSVHVEEVTLTLYVTPELQGLPIYIELVDVPFEQIYRIKTEPLGTVWHEVYPEFSLLYDLLDWNDNCNGVLDYCDWIWLMDPTGFAQWWHVEEISIDIKVWEPVHDVAVIDVYSIYDYVYQGYIDPIKVTVENQGDFTESVTVTAYYGGIPAAPSQIIAMPPGDTQTFTFYWNTTGIPPGSYQVSATAAISVDNDTSDNSMLGNWEEVKALPPYFIKPPYPDYAPSGMPDFDQKQDAWGPAQGIYTWCGPVAIANSLWWFDSEYESIYNPTPVPPPTISDSFPMVESYNPGVWDDHDPRNLDPLVRELAFLMDTDGQRTGLTHIGTNYIDMETGLSQYLQIHGINPYGDCDGDGDVDDDDMQIISDALGSTPGGPGWDMRADIVIDNIVDMLDLDLAAVHYGETGRFYEHTEEFPDFFWIEDEIERCEDVVLFLEFWRWDGVEWIPLYDDPSLEYGHFVTCAGVNSTTIELLLSDPYVDEAEAGFPGDIPVPHPSHADPTVHNDTQYVSHDTYNVALWAGPPPPLYPPVPVWELVNYLQQLGPYDPSWHAFIRAAVVTSPLGVHDVAVTNVTTSKTGCLPLPTVGEGFTANITVTVRNLGNFTETFNVNVYANATTIGTAAVTLNPGETKILTFVWDTTGFVKGNYTISATADTVTGETAIGNNTFIDGLLAVVRQGDVNGDGFVNAKDAILLGTAFYPAGTYNPNADINNDGYCNAKDAIIIGTNFDT